jgi:hypothetical protein
MARDAISEWGICQMSAGRVIPEPSTFIPRHGITEIVSWVDIDFDNHYRESNLPGLQSDRVLYA